MAITDTTYAQRLIQNFGNSFSFIIPEEGSLLFIENLVISKKSKNHKDAHKFINYMLSQQASEMNSAAFGLNPSNKNTYSAIDKRFLFNKNFFPDKELFKKLHLIHNDLPIRKIEELWLKIKSS